MRYELLTKYVFKCIFEYMQYITTTNLRTQTTKLVKALEKGDKVSLIHRSKVIGLIKPPDPEPKPFDPEKFKRIVKGLNLPKTTPEQRENIYRKHLIGKYGKNIS